jgi:signal peptidase I
MQEASTSVPLESSDRRTVFRVPGSHDILVSDELALSDQHPAPRAIHYMTRDVSKRGLSFQSRTAYHPGCQLNLRLQLGDEGPRFRHVGRVAWIKKHRTTGQYLIGISLPCDRSSCSTNWASSVEALIASSNEDTAPRVGLIRRVLAYSPAHPFIVALLGVVLSYAVFHSLVGSLIVEGESMSPTLEDGQFFMLNRLSYRLGKPMRGDIVVFKDPIQTDLSVKRIVGMPGEAISFKYPYVIINGVPLDEPYLPDNVGTIGAVDSSTVVVMPNQYFVLGDNRNRSIDSRKLGPIKKSWIKGRI